MMGRIFLIIFILGLLSGIRMTGAEEALPEFEGKIEYSVHSSDIKWSYTLWLKDSRWRSELKLGEALYELKIGNTAERTGFLVNDGGKNYVSLDRRGGPPGGDSQGVGRPNKSGKKGPKQIDPEKFAKWVHEKDDQYSLGKFSGNLLLLKGDGKAFEIYLCEELGEYSPFAIPTFKSTQEKGPLIAELLRKYPGIPLVVTEAGNEKKAFSMVASSITPEAVDDSLFTIPEEYTEQSQMRPQGTSGGGSGKRQGRPGGGGRPR